MTEELVALKDIVFPAFAAQLVNVADGLDDFRAAAIDACPTPANYHTSGENTGDCNFSSGEVWMESSSPNLNAEFSCVGDINLTSDCDGQNDDEQPVSAATASLMPPFSTGANAGFLRNDALLVIIAITDEDEQPTPNRNAQELYDNLIAVKGGDVKKMVFYGIGGEPSTNGCNPGTYGDADPANKLRELTALFEGQQRGVWHDLCQGNLEDGLAEALMVIESACEDFDPIE